MDSPTPEQVRAARESLGLTQAAAAAIIGKSYRSWQNWETKVGLDNHRTMDPALWKLFLMETKRTKRKVKK